MQRKEKINLICSEYPNLKFFFVKDLKLCANALCLYWIDEIHIDESLKDSPILDDIITHELKHYFLIQKILKARKEKTIKSVFKSMALMFFNNLWDLYDCLRIELKYYIIKLKRFIQKS